MDKKSLMIGIAFLLGAVYCIFSFATKGFNSFTLTALILFMLIGVAFIKKSRSR